MQTKNKLITFSLATMVLFSACATNQSQEVAKNTNSEQEIKLEAMKAIKTVAGALQTALNTKVKEGGLTNAVSFCSTNATALAKEVSKTLDEGVTLRRITDKPRNINNKANEEQLEVFKELKAKLANGEKVDMIVKQKSSNHYQVYKPIKVSGKCLNCHGTEKKRSAEAYSIISKKYPDDKAIDYKLDDFRGAFLVNIIK